LKLKKPENVFKNLGISRPGVGSKEDVHSFSQIFCRVAVHRENLENFDGSENVGKFASQKWKWSFLWSNVYVSLCNAAVYVYVKYMQATAVFYVFC